MPEFIRRHRCYLEKSRFEALPCLISALFSDFVDSHICAGKELLCKSYARLAELLRECHTVIIEDYPLSLYPAVFEYLRKLVNQRAITVSIGEKIVDHGEHYKPIILPDAVLAVVGISVRIAFYVFEYVAQQNSEICPQSAETVFRYRIYVKTAYLLNQIPDFIEVPGGRDNMRQGKDICGIQTVVHKLESDVKTRKIIAAFYDPVGHMCFYNEDIAALQFMDFTVAFEGYPAFINIINLMHRMLVKRIGSGIDPAGHGIIEQDFYSYFADINIHRVIWLLISIIRYHHK